MSIFEGMSDAHIAYAVRMAEKHYLSIGRDPLRCDVALCVIRDCELPAALASQPQAPAAAVPPGFALVPLEPTDGMLEAAHTADTTRAPNLSRWRAMLAAAPAPEVSGG